MAILSIVVTAGAFAVTSGESAGQRERASSNKAAIAKRAHEQLQGNVDARTFCDQEWTAFEKAAPRNTTPVVYPVCTWDGGATPWRLEDDDRRRYTIRATLRPVDEPGDGTGLAGSLDSAGPGGDADFDTRDRIDVQVTVQLDADSIAGLPSAVALDSYSLAGRTDWDVASSFGTARISVCLLDRPDRSMANGRCIQNAGTEEAPSQPYNGALVTLTRQGGGSSLSVTSSGGVASFNGQLAPGSYDVSVSNLAGNSLFKLAPKVITVEGLDPQDGTIYLSRPGSRFEVCGRITNPDNYGFGWKVTQSTLNWAVAGTPLRKGLVLSGLNDQWRCVATGLVDPLGYSNTTLFRGRYLVEIAGVSPDLSVTSAGACTTGNAANWGWTASVPTSPSQVLANPYAALRRGMDFLERDGNKVARMCIEYTSTPIEAVDCVEGSPGCILIDTVCSPSSCQPEPGCANCDLIPVPPDSSFTGNAVSSVHFGPNESTVACRNDQTATSFNSNVFYGGAAVSPRSTWQGFDFLGQATTPYKAKHPDGKWAECPEISFTHTASMTNACISFSLGNPCPGPQQLSLGDCLEVKINGRVVRGMLYDTFATPVSQYDSVGLVIGAWDRVIDHPNVDIDWHAWSVAWTSAPHEYGTGGLGWQTGFPMVKYREITNDPVCQSSSVLPEPEDEIIDVVPATVTEIWKTGGPDDVGDPAWPVPGLAAVQPVYSTKSL